MTPDSQPRATYANAARPSTGWRTPAVAAGALLLAVVASAQSPTEPSPDPRPNLKSGWLDACEASWNMRVVSASRPSDALFSSKGPAQILWNSDLAFKSHYAIQGNYSGFQIWDIANPQTPRVVTAYVCRGGQGDVSVYGNLLFVSVEENVGRKDCGIQGVTDSMSADRFRGIRIFDISDIEHPKLASNLQTCRGSQTNRV